MIPLNKDEKIVKLKIDIIFKRVFGNEQNEEIIAAFISDMLDIPRNRITHVEIKMWSFRRRKSTRNSVVLT